MPRKVLRHVFVRVTLLLHVLRCLEKIVNCYATRFEGWKTGYTVVHMYVPNKSDYAYTYVIICSTIEVVGRTPGITCSYYT